MLERSGIGELPLPAPSTAKCWGMEEGGDGEEVTLVACSAWFSAVGDDEGWFGRRTGELESCTAGDRVGIDDSA